MCTFFLWFRCKIPQCDTDDPSYDTDWLRSAVPFNNDSEMPYKCLKYQIVPYNVSETDSYVKQKCLPEMFDHEYQEKCDKWVFGETENTIVNTVSRIIQSQLIICVTN